MKVAVKNLKNKKVGEVELPEAVFDYPYKEHLIHLAVVSLRAAWRAGTHKVKGRGEIRSSGRKLYRQKGTGRARAGDAASPLRRSGGTVHGPRVRSHANKLSVREKRNALKSALSRKLADDQVIVVDSLELETHKTQELSKTLAALGVDGKALVVDQWDNENLALAARNNKALKTLDAMAVNVYDVVDRNHFIVSQPALERLVGVLQK